MINFRYHLVSLVAVFLALTIGIALGSTVVKESIVDSLNTRIDDVRQEADNRKTENDALQRRNSQQDQWIGESGALAVAGRLRTRQALIVAERGVDADAVREVVDLAQRAGGVAPAIIWLEDKLRADTPARRDDLRAALGITADDSAVRAAAVDLLVQRLHAGPANGADPLSALLDAGFVSVEAASTDGLESLDSFPTSAAAIVAVVGRGVALDDPTFVRELATACAQHDVPSVIAERDAGSDLAIYGGRATALAPVRTSDLADSVATVDDLDHELGRVSTVLALAESFTGRPGHYGTGTGAAHPFPTP